MNFCLRNAPKASTENARKKASAYMVEKNNEAGKKANNRTADRATRGPTSLVTRSKSATSPTRNAPCERRTAHSDMESRVTA
jgi:hypothetical protein